MIIRHVGADGWDTDHYDTLALTYTSARKLLKGTL